MGQFHGGSIEKGRSTGKKVRLVRVVYRLLIIICQQPPWATLAGRHSLLGHLRIICIISLT